MNGTKPPYKVPSMAEIAAIPWNGYNVVSTFSGGGGSCLGYRMAGYHVLWANEFVEEAQKTYRANHPDTYLDTRDIRDVTPEDILEQTGLKKGQLDLFDGSPPCCAFSTAGKREKSWGQKRDYSDGKKQQIETLFYEYIRLLRCLQPKVFIAENVSGLIKGKAIGYFKIFLNEMKSAGYNAKAQLLNSKWLGVPQARERVIFMGVRKDLNMKPVYPTPLPYYYTVGDAISDVVNDPEELNLRYEVMERTKMGQIVKKLKRNPPKPIKGSSVMNGSWFNLTRESMKHPCSTICQASGAYSTAGNIHPIEDRKFTIPEIKRLTSLPDDFILTGDLQQQWERVGRMVPPIMMMHIAKTVQTEILDKLKEGV